MSNNIQSFLTYINTLDKCVNEFNIFLFQRDLSSAQSSLKTIFAQLTKQIDKFSYNNTKDFIVVLNRLKTSLFFYLLNTETVLEINSYEYFIEIKKTISQIAYLTDPNQFDQNVELLLTPDSNGIINSNRLFKAFLLCTNESIMFDNFNNIFLQSNDLFINHLFSTVYYCSGSETAVKNRDKALNQLMNANFNYKSLPLMIINGIFMHSTYATTNNKDKFKISVNNVIRDKFKVFDIKDQYLESDTIFVLLEFFNPHHSVYRVLASSVNALRKKFKVIGICWPGFENNIPDFMFDEIKILNGNLEDFSCSEIKSLAELYKPISVYYPSIGMTQFAIVWSNVRFAKIQLAAIGHGATTCSSVIDYFVIESDISGDPDTFTEKLLLMPVGSMPYIRPAGVVYDIKKLEPNKTVINCGCVASSMKISCKFLNACKSILNNSIELKSSINLNFNFYIGNSLSLLDQVVITKLIKTFLPDANIYFKQPFQNYIYSLSTNDLLLTTFPFGGMNGMVDAACLGIPSICLDGNFVHEHFDAGLWSRFKLGDYLVSHNIDEYIEKAVSLIVDDRLREKITQIITNSDKNEIFFKDPDDSFADSILKLSKV